MQAKTHDPFRNKTLTVPQLNGTADPGDVSVNVLSIVDRYPPWINAGAEWMLHSIFRHLVEKGHAVRVATHIPEHFEPSVPEMVDGVEVWPVELCDVNELAEWSDVMVGHLLWTREVVTAASRVGRPLIYILHNEKQIGHWNLTPNNVTALVPNSEWIAETTRGWAGPQFVCRPPVFCEDYDVANDDRREYVTLVNMIPEKGVDTFYEVARQLHRGDFLGVTGAYGHQHRPPPQVGNVTMIPPTANMREDVYARTRILLMPSWYESWGRVAVEAMAAGCPVIAGPTPGLREALGDAALFIDPRDHKGWVRAVSELLSDGKLWRRMQKAGRERAAELERITDGDLDVFESWVRRCAAIDVMV